MVIGASAGGVETLEQVVSGFPAQLQATICVVLHIAPNTRSFLARILDRAGPLPCRPASDGGALLPGQILVAPPDRHLVIDGGCARLTAGPRENGHRPAVDPLFRSAADERGPGVVGVVLSGTRGDGAAGLAAVCSHGGATVVQDPGDALYPEMPETALDRVAVDAVVPCDRMAEAIVALVDGEAPAGPSTTGRQFETRELADRGPV